MNIAVLCGYWYLDALYTIVARFIGIGIRFCRAAWTKEIFLTSMSFPRQLCWFAQGITIWMCSYSMCR